MTGDPRESRLDALRAEAAASGTVGGAGVRPAGSPFPPAAPGYYGRPMLKPPVWTWEVPVYLFLGGLAGAVAIIGAGAEWVAGDMALGRAALWTAAVAGFACPLLLISDLGRPARFLNMLRVFKWRSPMSVGAWTLALFQGSVVLALLGLETGFPLLHGPGLALACLSGLLLLSYTGVLLAVTAIPVWARHRGLLPAQFSASALGSGAAALELLGQQAPALDALGLAAAAAELAVVIYLTRCRDPIDAPLHEGRSGSLLRAGGWLAGGLALLLRLVGVAAWAPAQLAAAASFLVGAYLIRAGWLAAGRASALDPAAVVQPGRGI